MYDEKKKICDSLPRTRRNGKEGKRKRKINHLIKYTKQGTAEKSPPIFYVIVSLC